MPSFDRDTELLSSTAVLTVPGLSFSRRRIIKVAMEEESPIDVNVDRSPVGAMPSSSKRLLVGNL
jgi:hypothetical protein